ncbi:MAG: carboxylating nicotinate-nucleotide diphosphorylase [Planctomycetaceae bacterium]|nr:carboxylating nicotinate-nucleotide diphosphorylase [Planctomycetaceae bacterium]
MTPGFGQSERAAAETLIGLALTEDLSEAGDLTSQALISENEIGEVNVVARKPGVLAGEPIGALVFERLSPPAKWTAALSDGERVARGTVIATVSGPLRTLLTGERTALNFLTHLGGIASLTRQFVDAAAGTRARILDTRKTHPGYRILEKYAVRCGGGTNHRMGLYDGVLIKDNHLAGWSEYHRGATLADAVRQAQKACGSGVSIEVEVDTLEQLEDVLKAAPQIVLLDNMSPAQMRQAVEIRDRTQPGTLLEASGGVTLDTIPEIARTGVERISSGALTHSAPALDIAFDWKGRREACEIRRVLPANDANTRE